MNYSKKDFIALELFFCNWTYVTTCAKQSCIHVVHPWSKASFVLLYFIIIKALYPIDQSSGLKIRLKVSHITMSALKQGGHFCKKQISVAASISSRPNSANRDKMAPEFPGSFNLSFGSAVFHTSKYSKDNLQQILKMVREAQ